MNWILCWFGWHRWARALAFAGHPRRECQRCGISQAHCGDLCGWTTEDAMLRELAREGHEIQSRLVSRESTDAKKSAPEGAPS